jgi:regulatory protein
MPFQRSAAKSANRQPLGEDELYEYAVRCLARRMRTVAEIKRLMQKRVEPGETGAAKIEGAIARLLDRGYLSDARYAADYTRIRQENQHFGRRRVQQELARRGISAKTAGDALEAMYSGVEEMDLARSYADRKRLKPPQSEKETARVVNSLIRGGFSTGTIFRLLKTWRVEADQLSAIENIEVDRETE